MIESESGICGQANQADLISLIKRSPEEVPEQHSEDTQHPKG